MSKNKKATIQRDDLASTIIAKRDATIEEHKNIQLLIRCEFQYVASELIYIHHGRGIKVIVNQSGWVMWIRDALKFGFFGEAPDLSGRTFVELREELVRLGAA